MVKLVIFDLDGTLLNTVGDLAAATNHALAANGYPGHPVEAYNFFVGNGIMKLFERALPEGARSQENIMKIREEFIPYYEAHGTDLTGPYPGITPMLAGLQEAGITMAVASNKYDAATKKLVARYFPEIEFAVVLGSREGVPMKPDPAIAEEILAAAGIGRSEALFVGDTSIDMQTAANAAIPAVGVTWGFRPRAELEAHNPAHLIDTPEQLPAIIGIHGKK